MISNSLGKESTSARIFQAVRDRIISGRYIPGSLLLEKELTGEFGVSRTPYREALRQLEAMNLVKIIPRYGTIVSEIDINEIVAAYEIRLRLESMAAELAALRRSPSDLLELRAIVERLECIAPGRDAIEEAKIDRALHECICRMSRNPLLVDYINNLRLVCGRIWTTAWWHSYGIDEMIAHWLTIYDCLAAMDGPGAAAAMTRHVQVSIDIVKNNLFDALPASR